MNKAIRDSKILGATMILNKFFDIYIHHAYEAIEKADRTGNYYELKSISAFSTIYLGQEVRIKNEGELEDSLWSLFESYKILLTIDKTEEEALRISSLINKERDLETKCLLKFQQEDFKNVD